MVLHTYVVSVFRHFIYQILGQAEEEGDDSDLSEAAGVAPFEMSTLKARAFKQTKREREEEMKVDAENLQIADMKSKRRSSLRSGKK